MPEIVAKFVHEPVGVIRRPEKVHLNLIKLSSGFGSFDAGGCRAEELLVPRCRGAEIAGQSGIFGGGFEERPRNTEVLCEVGFGRDRRRIRAIQVLGLLQKFGDLIAGQSAWIFLHALDSRAEFV